MRIEYSGGSADGSSENNGLSLYGVGNGTTVEFVQTFEGLDDGVEFFGGTVNASNIVVTGAQDDSIDWTEGYSGTITDAYVQHGAEHDKGIEGDGFNTDIGQIDTSFISSPTLNNVTILGVDGEAIRLRVGTEAEINNLYLSDFEEGIEIDDEQTGNSAVGGIVVIDATFNNVTTPFINVTGVEFTEDQIISGVGNGTQTDFATWGAGWTR